MEPLVSAPTLPERALQHLRDAIRSGRWRDSLPSERALAEALRISRPTLRLALARLKEEGLLRVENRRTLICRTKTRAVKRASAAVSGASQKPVLLVSPLAVEDMPAAVLVACQELAARLAARERSLRVIECRAFRSQKPERALARLLRAESGAGGWILHRAPLAVQQFFQNAGVPCTLLGNPHPDIPLPAVSLNFAAVARHAAAALRRLGHRPDHIAVIISDSRLAGNEAVLRGVAEALGTDGFRTVRHDEDGANLSALTDRLLSASARPTALIVHRPTAALTMASRAQSAHRLRIPADLSLVCLEASRSLAAFQPPLARYHHRYRPIGRSLADIIEALMSGIQRPGQQFHLLPQLIAGESLARPGR
jgi:DNA-binding LacI/PurR family transcriptional regulator